MYTMKSKKLIISVVALVLISLNWACEDRVYQTYMANKPVYMNFDEFRSAVKSSSVQNFEQPGKIYLKDNYIFVNEYLKGIHVIDNSNPASPQLITFIEIPGNIDMSIKDNRLFADSYMDLVSIDISDINNVSEIKRIEDLFPYTLPPYDEEYPVAFIDYNEGVVIGWEVKEITEELESNNYPVYYNYALESVEFDGTTNTADGGSSVGVGGSMARFTATLEALYTTSSSQLSTININDDAFSVVNKEYIGWNVETIFPYDDKLFFGTQTGMLIYDISIPLAPQYITSFSHIRSCDPVVVHDTLAYITLRSGSSCWTTTNRLDIVNIKTITEPNLVHSVSMVNPHGLGISDTILFVCDGEAGLKVYDVSNPLEFENHKLAEFPDINAYDAIPFNEILMLIGEDGLMQYTYSDPTNIQLISSISLK